MCVYSQDADGRISLTDLVNSCNTLDLGVGEEAVRAYHREMDTNGDGFVDYEEWMAAMRNPEGLEEVLRSRGLDSAGEALTTATTMAPQDMINTIAASLAYNKLSTDEGYDAFDVDQDGKVSLDDLRQAIATLDLDLSPEDVFAEMRGQANGFIDRGVWSQMIQQADADKVLRSRGVEALESGSEAPSTQAPVGLQAALNHVAAALRFNTLDLEQGFEAFDVDQDGMLSLEDLRTAVHTLQLQVHEEDVATVHRAMGPGADGLCGLEGWKRLLETADGSELLRSRGVYLEAEEGAQAPIAGGPDGTPPEQVRRAADVVAAALAYNGLSPAEGYDSFDVDQDGGVSLGDLTKSAEMLQLDLTAGDLAALHAHLAGGGLHAGREAWGDLLAAARPDDVLKSRGVAAEDPAAPAGGGGEDVQAAVDVVAAALAYNGLSVDEGYHAFDDDQDGTVSRADLDAAVSALQLDVPPGGVSALFAHLDPQGTGGVTLEAWRGALAAADAESVLRSRGVTEAVANPPPLRAPTGAQGGAAAAAPPPPAAGSRLQQSLDTVAAALAYNELSTEDGYDAFDADQDGEVSPSDLREAVATLQLDLTPADVEELLSHLSGGAGAVPRERWAQALAAANPEAGLQSRGIATESVGFPAVRASVAEIAAALRYNGLSDASGYDAFDEDEDGKVSLGDLTAAVATLNLSLDEASTTALFSYLEDQQLRGFIDREAWAAALARAGEDASAILGSRGVQEPPQEEEGGSASAPVGAAAAPPAPEAATPAAPVDLGPHQRALNLLAAALRYNGVSDEDGYDAVDADEDGAVSVADVGTACERLQLEVERGEVDALFAAWAGAGAGSISRGRWAEGLRQAAVDDVLHSRGVVLEGGEGGADPAPAAAPAAAAAPGEAGGAGGGVGHSVSVVAAALRYNNLSVTEGYEAVDADGDGRVSHDDLRQAVAALELDLTEAQVAELVAHLDPGSTGFVPPERWEEALALADVDAVLRSRGVEVPPGIDAGVQKTIDTVAAALVYNGLDYDQGFDAVDQDEDGRVSLGDLRGTAAELKLDASPEDVDKMHKVLARGGEWVERRDWVGAMAASNASEVLQSRGVGAGDADAAMQRISDQIAALFAYNGLSPAQGYEQFDHDGDGVVSEADLKASSAAFELAAGEEELGQWFATVDKELKGHLALDDWVRVLERANASGVLQSHGVDLVAEEALRGHLREVATLITGALRFKGVPVEGSFAEFDADGDGGISLDDVQRSAARFSLGAAEAQLRGFHADAGRGVDKLTPEDWARALSLAEEGGALATVGIATAGVSTVGKGPEEALDMVAACLQYNQLSVADGFNSFDMDEDGKVSLDDLRTSVRELELGLTEVEVRSLHGLLDEDRDGVVSPGEWARVLGRARAGDVLRSRGLEVLDEAPPLAAAPGGGGGMEDLQGEDVEAAATKIQAIQRGRAERKRAKAAAKQRAADKKRERMAAMADLQGEDVEAAATKIQAIQRGRAQRKRAKQLERQRQKMAPKQAAPKEAPHADLQGEDVEAAAVKIQAVQRGRSQRKRANGQREAQRRAEARKGAAPPPKSPSTTPAGEDMSDLQGQDVEAAATKIQAIQRGRAERKRAKAAAKQRAADKKRERMAAMADLQGEDVEAAATKIQAIQRGRAQRKRAKQLERQRQKMAPKQAAPAPAPVPPPTAGSGPAAAMVGAVNEAVAGIVETAVRAASPNAVRAPSEQAQAAAAATGAAPGPKRVRRAEEMTRDEAATLIQKRGRGMNARKAFILKKRRYGKTKTKPKGPGQAAAPKAAAATGKQREMMRTLNSKEAAPSQIQVPGSAPPPRAEPFSDPFGGGGFAKEPLREPLRDAAPPPPKAPAPAPAPVAAAAPPPPEEGALMPEDILDALTLVTLTLDDDFDMWRQMNGAEGLRGAVARASGVDAQLVRVLQAQRGSVVASVALLSEDIPAARARIEADLRNAKGSLRKLRVIGCTGEGIAEDLAPPAAPHGGGVTEEKHKKELEFWKGQLKAATDEHDALTRKLASAEDGHKKADARAERASDDLIVAKAEGREALDKVMDEVYNLRAQAEGLKQKVAEAEEGRKAAEARASAAEAVSAAPAAAAGGEELEKANGEVARLQGELNAAKEALVQAEEGRNRAREGAEGVVGRLERSAGRLAELEEQLAALERGKADLQAQISSLSGQQQQQQQQQPPAAAEAAPAAPAGDEVRALASVVATSLLFSRLTASQGFTAFDADGDGEISAEDMRVSARALGLGDFESQLARFHTEACRGEGGRLTMAGWSRALALGNVASMLEGGGLAEPVGGPEEAAGMVGAALLLNQLTIEEGFAAFDADGDGKVSIADMSASVASLQLGLSPEQVQALQGHLDADKDGFVSRGEWEAGMRAADINGVLRARHLFLVPSRQGAGEPAAARATGGAGEQDDDHLDHKEAHRETLEQLERVMRDLEAAREGEARERSGRQQAAARVEQLELDAQLSAAAPPPPPPAAPAPGPSGPRGGVVAPQVMPREDQRRAAAMVTSSLLFSRLTVEEGFKAFDLDGDGAISGGDMRSAIEQLGLSEFSDLLMRFHADANRVRDGRLSRQEWARALAGVDVQGLLFRPGGEGVSPGEAAGMVGAALLLNQLTVEEGFAAFDADGDGKVSREDMGRAASVLEMQLSPQEVDGLFALWAPSGEPITPQGWEAGLQGADVNGVIRTRDLFMLTRRALSSSPAAGPPAGAADAAGNAGRLEELERLLGEERSAARELEEKLEQTLRAGGELERRVPELEDARGKVVALAARVAQLEGAAAQREAAAPAAQAAEAGGGADERPRAELEAEVDSLKSALEAIRPELDHALTLNQEVDQQLADAAEEAERRGAELEKARQELAAAREEGVAERGRLEGLLKEALGKNEAAQKDVELLENRIAQTGGSSSARTTELEGRLRDAMAEAEGARKDADAAKADAESARRDAEAAGKDAEAAKADALAAAERAAVLEAASAASSAAGSAGNEEAARLAKEESARLHKELDDARAEASSEKQSGVRVKQRVSELEERLAKAEAERAALLQAPAPAPAPAPASAPAGVPHDELERERRRADEAAAQCDALRRDAEAQRGERASEAARLREQADREAQRREASEAARGEAERELAALRGAGSVHEQIVKALEARLAAADTQNQALRERAEQLQDAKDAGAGSAGAVGAEFRRNLEVALADKAQLDIELFATKQQCAALEQRLSDALKAGGGGVPGSSVAELSANAARLVEEGRRLGDELRASEAARADLESKVRALEARGGGGTDAPLLQREKEGLQGEVSRLVGELAEKRVQLTQLEAELQAVRGAGGSPGRPAPPAASGGGGDLRARLEEALAAKAEAEDKLARAEARLEQLSREGGEGGLRRLLQEAEDRLAESERDRRALEQELERSRVGSQGVGSSAGAWETASADGGGREAHERTVRMRQLLKENAEWRAQVRQLSAEVVGLTEALEMVTKRAQDKDAKHSELQQKTDRILRLAGLVDPSLPLGAGGGGGDPPHSALPARRRKKKSSSRTRAGSASPGRRGEHHHPLRGGEDPPPRAYEGWGEAPPPQQAGGHPTYAFGDDGPGVFPSVRAAMMRPDGPGGGGGGGFRPASASRQRPQSARARIERLDAPGGSRVGGPPQPQQPPHPHGGGANGVAWGDGQGSPAPRGRGDRREYLPPATRGGEPYYEDGGGAPPPARRPVSASAAPQPPDASPSQGYGAGGRGAVRASGQLLERGGDGVMSALGVGQTLRPFSYLVRGVQDGAVTGATPLRIVVEFCNSEHYSRRHDIARYQHLYERVAAAMHDQLRGRVILLSPNGRGGGPAGGAGGEFEPRAGAFEVFVEWQGRGGETHMVVLFSKLELMRYPNPANLAQRLRVVLQGGEDPGAGGLMVGEVEALP